MFAAECKITFKIQAASVMHCSFCIIRAILLFPSLFFFVFFFPCLIPLRYVRLKNWSSRSLLGQMDRGQACSHRIKPIKHFLLESHPCCLEWMYFKYEIQNIYVQVEADTVYIHIHIYVYVKEVYVHLLVWTCLELFLWKVLLHFST